MCGWLLMTALACMDCCAWLLYSAVDGAYHVGQDLGRDGLGQEPAEQGRRLSPAAPTSGSVIVSMRVQMLTFCDQRAIVALILVSPRLPGIEP